MQTENATPQQIKIDELCQLAAGKNTRLSDFIDCFLAGPKVSINDRQSIDNVRPIELAALSGNISLFTFIVEDLHADISATDSNLIVYSSSLYSCQHIRDYLFTHKLWERFQDGTTESLAKLWYLPIEEAKTLVDAELRDSGLNDEAEYERFKRIKHFVALRKHYSPEDTLQNHLSQYSHDVESDISIELAASRDITVEEIVLAFCDLISDDESDSDDIKEFLECHPGFDINTTAQQNGLPGVYYALQSGSLDSIMYLIDELQASLHFKNNMHFMNEVLDPDVKHYICSNRLWHKLQNGTTDCHGFAWAGDIAALEMALKNNPHQISDLTADHKSVFDWAQPNIKNALYVLSNQYLDSIQAGDPIYKINYYNCLAQTSVNSGDMGSCISLLRAALAEFSHIITPSTELCELGDGLKRKLAFYLFTQLTQTGVAANVVVFDTNRVECLQILETIIFKKPVDYQNYGYYKKTFEEAYSTYASQLTAQLQPPRSHSLYGSFYRAIPMSPLTLPPCITAPLSKDENKEMQQPQYR